VVSSARRSVVQFEVDGKPVVLGTVIKPAGLVLTKASELKPGKLTATLWNGRTATVTEFVTDPQNDVALVRLDAKDLPAVTWANETMLGQWVVTPGLGSKPEAVGVLSASTRKLHKRAYAGVVLDSMATNAAIASVRPGFGAEKAGLRGGDVVVAVNETRVNDSDALRNVLREFHAGQTVQLHVQRDGEEFAARVEMQADPESEAAARRFGPSRQSRLNRFGGALSERAEDFELALQHDTVLQPWQCGGPLLNLDGKAIGLNIARAGRVATYALPAELVHRLVVELEALPMEPVSRPAQAAPVAPAETR
jgi:serine protease Do